MNSVKSSNGCLAWLSICSKNQICDCDLVDTLPFRSADGIEQAKQLVGLGYKICSIRGPRQLIPCNLNMINEDFLTQNVFVHPEQQLNPEKFVYTIYHSDQKAVSNPKNVDNALNAISWYLKDEVRPIYLITIEPSQP